MITRLLLRGPVGALALAGSMVLLGGCASVAEYERDLIKKHEKTRADKENDRVRHLLTQSAHAEPVFLTYRSADDARRASLAAAGREARRLGGQGQRLKERRTP